MVTAPLAQWSWLGLNLLGHGELTAQSRRGHSSITTRLQLAVSIFSMIMARHSSVTAGCDHFGHREQSQWPFFFSWECIISQMSHCIYYYMYILVRQFYVSVGLALLTQCDAVTSLSANCSAAFKWKLRCHWLKGFWRHLKAAMQFCVQLQHHWWNRMKAMLLVSHRVSKMTLSICDVICMFPVRILWC